MTVIGPDRPGLVEALANIVVSHGGNWLESRMSRLGGQFAGILRVSLPPDQERAAAAALAGLQTEGLAVVIHADNVTETAPAPLSLLEIVGNDRPGIVREISRILALNHVNVEELSSQLSSAAMSGETLFKASATLRIPPSCDQERLRAELEKIANDLIVDITLQPAA